MIDHEARAQMAAAMRAYMADELTAFRFDEELERIEAATTDGTAQAIRLWLWGLYDDLKDHPIIASKPVWDFMGRLMLVLESGGEIEMAPGRRRWRMDRVALAAALVAVAVVVPPQQPGLKLVAWNLASALALAALDRREEARMRPLWTGTIGALRPYGSLAELRAARRRVSGFRRPRFRPCVAGRQMRGPGAALAMRLHMALLLGFPLLIWRLAAPEEGLEGMRVRLPGVGDSGASA